MLYVRWTLPIWELIASIIAATDTGKYWQRLYVRNNLVADSFYETIKNIWNKNNNLYFKFLAKLMLLD